MFLPLPRGANQPLILFLRLMSLDTESGDRNFIYSANYGNAMWRKSILSSGGALQNIIEEKRMI